ncbi:endonuclease/exonuclease/phosphatase family metal-dependent hydrolase [Arcticibacter pallidicorallinus]|uniref:Endonuclease/exonuclease/phosphatase family metal-dependent hydrolase n=1 Tax=Arcticibacter pallidicorallinus TaxID=1259464 RepID=A0A2T0U9E0_9SPHI|nr:endonuclease/exonuclease/phosphatase family protein [Arcticibacter pallidicorallinus]PRY54492.1 endonuclease/exonuclease/phosphatase family metal-dependent hydrolase [Arcticibacter pallidicorallinus]
MIKLLKIISILACIALLLSILGAYVDPRSFWPLAFMSLAYVPLLAGNLLLLTYWLIKWSRFALIPLCCILLSWPILAGSFSLSKRASLSSKQEANDSLIRIMTYNVHAFDEAFRETSQSKKVLDLIERIQPDIACLQEYHGVPDHFNPTDSLKRILNTPHFHHAKFNGGGLGLAIFSKYPIVGTGLIKFSEDGDGNHGVYIDVIKNDKTFRIYTVHLESIRLRQDQLNYMSQVIKGKTKQLRPSKKIGGQLRRAFFERAGQVDIVKQHIATCPYPYIVCGDFNDPPSSYAFNEMAEGMQSTYRKKGSGLYAVTLHKGFLRYQIDHILVSKNFDVYSHVIIPEQASDHYPVYADLALK